MSTLHTVNTHKHITLGVARAGQAVDVPLHKYSGGGLGTGTVHLRGDGRADGFLKSVTDPVFTDLTDARVQRFAARASELARDFQPGGSQADRYCEWTLSQKLGKVADGIGIPGRPYVIRDRQGYVHLNANIENESRGIIQDLSVRQDSRGSSVVLFSGRLGEGSGYTHHRLQAPIREDSSLDMGQVQESLEVQVPWFDARQLEKAESGAIQSVFDPRLEKVIDAANLGRRLSAEALGPQWQLQNGENCQFFRHTNQTISSDLLSGEVVVKVETKPWEVGSNAVHYQNGVFRRGNSSDGREFHITYGSSYY
jgi:hypothetical protein